MNFSNIKYNDISNGKGVRTSLFVSGCDIRCPGCFNSIAWDFNSGKEFTSEILNQIIDSLKSDYIEGLSILGGEPLSIKNQPEVLKLILMVRNFCRNKTIYLWTGYYIEDLLKDPSPYIREILENLDMVVDGPFDISKKVLDEFRGSSNQRFLNKTKLKEILNEFS